jgi:WD40 repeat protein
VRFWDTATGQPSLPNLPHRTSTLQIAFSPDGNRLLVVLTDATVQVWNLTARTLCGPTLRHEGPVSHASFTPDSRHVLTASHDWCVRLWNPDSGTLVGEPLTHDGIVVSTDQRPDGGALLTATRSGRLQLWHDYRHLPHSSTLGTWSGLWNALFSPDGTAAACVGSEHAARIVHFPTLTPSIPDWLPTLAEAVAGRSISPQWDIGFVPPEELLKITQEINALPPTNAINRWAQWLLNNQPTRSPYPPSS